MPRSVSKLSKKKLKTTRSVRIKPTGRVLRQSTKKRRGARRRVPNWSRIFLFFGFLCLSFWGIHKFLYYRSLSFSRSQATHIVKEQPKAVSLPTHIFIPWNTDSDIEALPFANGQWSVSDTKVTYLLGSARPGEPGNIILYGHNKREILGNIRALKGGERVTMRTSDGNDHIYTVISTKEVDPSDVSLLSPTTTEILTMYTCSGFWDSQRFIVRAVPVK